METASKIDDYDWKPEIIVFGGGGIKGLCLPGVLRVISKHEFMSNVHTFAGASIGGLVAALCSIGYNCSDISSAMQISTIEKLLNGVSMSRRLKYGYAVDDECMQSELTKILAIKNIKPDITLEQAYKMCQKNLYLTSVNRKTRRSIMLSHRSHPNLSLIEALKMTTCVPCIFKSPIHNGDSFWDGGLLDNYPVSHFPQEKVLGVRLSMRDAPTDEPVKSSINMDPFEGEILGFIAPSISTLIKESTEVIDIMMDEIERVRIAGMCFREICVDTRPYKSLSFSVSNSDLIKLTMAGVNAAMEFMENKRPKVHIPKVNEIKF